MFAEEARKRQESGVNQYTDEGLKENFPQAETGKASDEAGDLFGVSGRSVRDAKYVADHDPEA